MGERTTSETGASTPRALGRIVLAGLLALAVGLVVLPLSLGIAQETAGIEIVNPNDSSSAIVSDKARPYELTAWTVNLPADPSVQFQVKDAEENVVAGPFEGIPTAGRPDTFAFDWTIADELADGTYMLEASLMSAAVAVDTATQEFTLNQTDDGTIIDPAAAISETVALSYPVNGGPLGIHIPTTGPANFVIEGSSTPETEEVVAYYSVSATGTDPTFVQCGTATLEEGGDFSIRCEIAEADPALDVSAVAAVANKAGALPLPVDDVPGAADGHTVSSYRQFASTFAVNPEAAGSTTVDFCQIFTAELKDQEGRPIAGANIDVHAQGPNDMLKFDVSGTYSDPNQAPDAGPHDVEPGFVCNENGQGGADDEADSQGSHTIADQPSRKHIESVDDGTATAGTDNEGKFDFALHSAANGETQVVAWADVDGDDLLCDDEPQDYATIGWGIPAPAPTGQEPDVPSCTLPSPSPTASPSASASASPTASPSPTVSPTPDQITWIRSITVNTKHKGRRLLVNGRVSSEGQAPDGCTENVKVRIERKKKGDWKRLRKVATNNNGRYKSRVRDKAGRYRAIAPAFDLNAANRCAGAKKGTRHRH